MRGALAVRINDGYTDRTVTAAVRDLRFTRTAPGGFAFASMRLVLPRDTFRDLGPADRVWIYDARTGRTVWQGFTDNPGASDGPGGQEYDLSASGSTVLAGDESRSLIYVDRDLGRWQEIRGTNIAPSATAQSSDNPAGADTDEGSSGVLCQLNPGQPIGTGKSVAARHIALAEAGMAAGVVKVDVVSGKIDSGFSIDMSYFTVGGGPGTNGASVLATSLSTAPASFTCYANGTQLPVGTHHIGLRLRRTGPATNVADDDTWSFFSNICVIAQLVDQFSAPASMASAGASGTLTADQVVRDLAGRVLTFADSQASIIEPSSAAIDQLAYPEGATAQQVLDDLTLWEPDLLWEVLEDTGSGYRFNYRTWPTTPRYEITTRDGYEAPGGDVDLCNRIAVFWTDAKGVKRTTVVTATVPELGGRTKDAEPIELPEGLGSESNAQAIGAEVLAGKSNPPKAATAVVRRPILDLLTGLEVMPWEIEPGYMVRVRETGDDLRLTEVEYTDEDCAATLTLGTPVLTDDQRIAKLSRRR